MTSKYRVLFFHSNPVPPDGDPARYLQFHISRCCEVDLVSGSWLRRSDITPERLAELSRRLGAFEYHPIPRSRLPGPARFLGQLFAYVRRGLDLSRRKGRFDAIICYGPFTTSIAGLIVSRLTGAKLVIEIPGPPTGAFAFEGGWLNKLKLRIARLIVPRLLRKADAIHLLYAWQLDDLPGGPFPPAFVFPDFVPISLIPAPGTDSPSPGTPPYILFLGFPFALKGVDVLIKAFRIISPRHPDVILRIIGFCPDPAPYLALAADHPRIRIEKAVKPPQAMEIMAGCTLFALASRAEGVPRVLIEALAARKPVVSTPVGGIPALIEHERNGLLVEKDNVEDFARQMDRLLSDPALAERLAAEGHRQVFEELTEECYARNVWSMLEQLAGPRPGEAEPVREREEEAPGSLTAR